jgi:hypothetical protein
LPTTIPGSALADGLISLSKMASGVGTRLLAVMQLSPAAAGANSVAYMMSDSVQTHHNKPCWAVYLNTHYIDGPDSINTNPNSGGVAISLDGGLTGLPTRQNLIATPFPVFSVVAYGVLNGNHTWRARLSMANNATAIRAYGYGILALFEQY